VYVSGALTGIVDPETTKRFYESVAEVCQERGFPPYLPHQSSDPLKNPRLTPSEVYQKNRFHVLRSSLLIAYVGLPSLGVGAEIELASQHGIPILGSTRESVGR